MQTPTSKLGSDEKVENNTNLPDMEAYLGKAREPSGLSMSNQ